MRADIRANLEREVRRRVQARVKDQVMKALLDNATLEVPKALVEMEIERLMAGMRQDLAGRGVKAEEIPMPREAFEPEARKRVTLGPDRGRGGQAERLCRPSRSRSRRWSRNTRRATRGPRRWCAGTTSPPERLREVESLVLEDNVVAVGAVAASRSRTSRPISTN